MASVIAAVVLALLLVVPARGRADETVRRARFEVWVGGSLADPALNAAYVTRYSPTFGLGGGAQAVDSVAGQSLAVHADPAVGGEVGLGWSPDGRWGVRLSVARSAGGLSGRNGPYSWSARFLSSQPPDTCPGVEDEQTSIGPIRRPPARDHAALGAFRRSKAGAWAAASPLEPPCSRLGEIRTSASPPSPRCASTFFTQESREAAIDPRPCRFHAGADVDVALARLAERLG